MNWKFGTTFTPPQTRGGRFVLLLMKSVLLHGGILSCLLQTEPGAAQQPRQVDTSKGDHGLMELRIYPLKQDMIANAYWYIGNANSYFSSPAVGMSVGGQFADQDAGRYIWFRTYPDEATRQKQFHIAYDSDVWKSGTTIRRGIKDTGFSGSLVFMATPTKYSKLQFPFTPSAESAVKGEEAQRLTKLFADAPDGQVPDCGKCGSNPFIFEVSIYDIKLGMMDTFVDYMGQKVIPQEEAHGVREFAQLVPYARLVSINDGGSEVPEDSTFIVIRLFPDDATRRKQEKSLSDLKEGSPEALEAEGVAGLNHIVYVAHPTFYSEMQR